MSSNRGPSSFRVSLLVPIAAAAVVVPLPAQCTNGPVFGTPIHGPDTLGPTFVVRHGDFDNDGDEDLVYRANSLEFRRNDGAAGFTPVLSFAPPVGLVSIAVGDLDRDGWLDVVVVGSVPTGPSQYRTHVRTLRNTGPAAGFVAFAASDIVLNSPTPGLLTAYVAMGDLDADGMLDLAVTDGRGTAWVLRAAGSHGVPSGAFQTPVGYAIGPASRVGIEIADMNQDGVPDLCMMAYSGDLRVLAGQANAAGRPLGTFGPLHSAAIAVASADGSLIVRDFDRDGLPDVAFRDINQIKVARGLGGFLFAAPVAFALPAWSPEAPFAGDFDRDGRVDIAVPCSENAFVAPNFRVLRDPLGAPAFSQHNLDTGYPMCGVALDHDRDGLLDVAVGKSSDRVTTARGQCAVLPPPVVTVVQPNGGNFLPVGQQTTIAWTCSTAVAAFDVDVSFDDGATWAPVARQVTSTSCSWWAHEPSTNRGRFRVMPADLPVFADTSDGPVTIGGPGLASAVPLGTGCGQPFAPSANATVPHLGGTTRLELLGASPNVLAAWWLSVPLVPPLPLAGGIGCFVWLDPAAITLLSLGSTDANGHCVLDVPVPGNPALQGLALAAQATAFVPASPLGLQLSNGVGLRLGF